MKNVSGENLSYRDILYNFIKQFEFASNGARVLRSVCKRIIIIEEI